VETESHELEREVVRRVLTDAGATVEDYPDLVFVDWRDGFWIASNFSSTDQQAPIPEGVSPVVGTRLLKPAGVAIWP
jgi:beta-galactosidase